MISIRRLDASDAWANVDGLAEVLVDCVEAGASVSFMQPFSRESAVEFFEKVAKGVEAGERILMAAFAEEALVGTVQILTATPPNQPHRADVTKLLVHRSARKRGIANLLMREVERESEVRGQDAARVRYRHGRGR
jgi:ribosomal protein S18 acetylase RimI-like enzyme